MVTFSQGYSMEKWGRGSRRCNCTVEKLVNCLNWVIEVHIISDMLVAVTFDMM